MANQVWNVDKKQTLIECYEQRKDPTKQHIASRCSNKMPIEEALEKYPDSPVLKVVEDLEANALRYHLGSENENTCSNKQ